MCVWQDHWNNIHIASSKNSVHDGYHGENNVEADAIKPSNGGTAISGGSLLTYAWNGAVGTSSNNGYRAVCGFCREYVVTPAGGRDLNRAGLRPSAPWFQ